MKATDIFKKLENANEDNVLYTLAKTKFTFSNKDKLILLDSSIPISECSFYKLAFDLGDKFPEIMSYIHLIIRDKFLDLAVEFKNKEK